MSHDTLFSGDVNMYMYLFHFYADMYCYVCKLLGPLYSTVPLETVSPSLTPLINLNLLNILLTLCPPLAVKKGAFQS